MQSVYHSPPRNSHISRPFVTRTSQNMELKWNRVSLKYIYFFLFTMVLPLFKALLSLKRSVLSSDMQHTYKLLKFIYLKGHILLNFCHNFVLYLMILDNSHWLSSSKWICGFSSVHPALCMCCQYRCKVVGFEGEKTGSLKISNKTCVQTPSKIYYSMTFCKEL